MVSIGALLVVSIGGNHRRYTSSKQVVSIGATSSKQVVSVGAILVVSIGGSMYSNQLRAVVEKIRNIVDHSNDKRININNNQTAKIGQS